MRHALREERRWFDGWGVVLFAQRFALDFIGEQDVRGRSGRFFQFGQREEHTVAVAAGDDHILQQLLAVESVCEH